VTNVVDVQANQVVDMGAVGMFSGCTIQGRVNLPAGAAIQVAEVEVTGAPGFETRREMAMDGSFSIPGLPAGSYTLRARSVIDQAWGPSKTVEISPDKPAEVVLDTGR
jgi:hypothetical protein